MSATRVDDTVVFVPGLVREQVSIQSHSSRKRRRSSTAMDQPVKQASRRGCHSAILLAMVMEGQVYERNAEVFQY